MTETRKLLEKLRDKLKDYAPIMWADDIAEIDAHLASGGCELTEEMIDAPRYFILYTETPGRTLEGAREHMRLSGVSIDCWPNWAKENTGHLTKSVIAELIWHMMNAAQPLPPLPKEGE